MPIIINVPNKCPECRVKVFDKGMVQISLTVHQRDIYAGDGDTYEYACPKCGAKLGEGRI